MTTEKYLERAQDDARGFAVKLKECQERAEFRKQMAIKRRYKK